MSDLINLGVKETKDTLLARKCSAVELLEAYITRIEKYSHLNAFITKTFDQAHLQAESADLSYKKGTARKLEGIPIALKDLFCTKDILTSAGSLMLSNFIPKYESTVSQKLKDVGVISLGKTNMDEFAMGSANITSYYGHCLSPWHSNKHDMAMVPGGSSGGSAAAVAARLCLGATGSDTGGSIRQPAAFTGIVGIKPTYGRCSRYGMVAFASSLDQAGILARNVTDAALLLEPMMGHDPKDSTSSKKPVDDLTSKLGQSIKGLRIGIPKEYISEHLNPETKQAWENVQHKLQDLGVEIIDISLPHTEYGLTVYYIIAPAEASSNLARYDGVRYGYRTDKPVESIRDMYEFTRAEGFGDEVKRRIMIGTYVLSAGYYDAYYRKAQRVRTLIRQDFELAFQKIDLILTPTSPTVAFPIEKQPTDPIAMYLNDLYTIPTSIAGLPAISIPSGLNSEGLPIGLQLIAKAFDEVNLLQVAYALEQEIGFNHRPKGY